jgi:hypothetical protein
VYHLGFREAHYASSGVRLDFDPFRWEAVEGQLNRRPYIESWGSDTGACDESRFSMATTAGAFTVMYDDFLSVDSLS